MFDSAFDGLENAKLAARGPRGEFNFTFEGASEFGHKAYYEAPLPAGETLGLVFRAEAGPQVSVRLDLTHEYVCGGPSNEPRTSNASLDDDLVRGFVAQAPGECAFVLGTKRDLGTPNGVNLVWEATTIAFDERDAGPGGGVPLQFAATRS